MIFSEKGWVYIAIAVTLIAFVVFFPILFLVTLVVAAAWMAYELTQGNKFWQEREKKDKKFQNCGKPECVNCTSCKHDGKCGGHNRPPTKMCPTCGLDLVIYGPRAIHVCPRCGELGE